MRIVIATTYLPWPLTDGGRVAQFRTLEALRGVCRFTLVVPIYGPGQEPDVVRFGELFPQVKVVAVPCFQSKPWGAARDCAQRLIWGLLRKFAPALSSRLAQRRQHQSGTNRPYYAFGNLDPDFVTAVQEQVDQGCDIFQAEFADMLTLGPLMAGRVPTIFVHHQPHFVYLRRFMEANGLTDAPARYLTERMVREEAAYLNSFDAAIVFSQVDRQALKDFVPALAVSVSPFPAPEDPLPAALPFAGGTRCFVFVAGDSHRPNVEGLGWFMKDVWPGIKPRLAGARIEVIGTWSPSAQASLPHYEDIAFSGFVPELVAALQNKIMIVPVRVGSGIRTKILAAWSAGCPVVTTRVGAEGLPGQPGEHFSVAADAAAFAAACVELAQDVNQLNRLAAHGLELVQSNYSLAAVRQTRLEIYEKLIAARRPKN